MATQKLSGAGSCLLTGELLGKSCLVLLRSNQAEGAQHLSRIGPKHLHTLTKHSEMLRAELWLVWLGRNLANNCVSPGTIQGREQAWFYIFLSLWNCILIY